MFQLNLRLMVSPSFEVASSFVAWFSVISSICCSCSETDLNAASKRAEFYLETDILSLVGPIR